MKKQLKVEISFKNHYLTLEIYGCILFVTKNLYNEKICLQEYV